MEYVIDNVAVRVFLNFWDGVIDDVISYTPAACATSGVLWPVVLDHDNDGTIEVGVFDPATREWCLEGRSVFTWPSQGGTDLIPVVGDWDGDGDDTVGLYSPSLETFKLNDNMPPSGSNTTVAYGDEDVFPVVGDWDDDGDDQVGYYDWATQTFYPHGEDPIEFSEVFLDNFDGFQNDAGLPHTVPLAGNWDTDGAAEGAPYSWPTGTPTEHDMDDEILQEAEDQAREAGHVNSLLVVRNGELIWEEYFNGYTANNTNNIKSASKSVLSALFGIAGKQGCIPNYSSYGDKVAWLNSIQMNTMISSDYSGFSNSIKLKHMMTMTAGIVWNEEDNLAPMVLDDDWIDYIDSQTYNSSHLGNKHYYSSGLTHIGAELLRRYTATGNCTSGTFQDTYDFAQQELFTPLGISTTRWDHEPSSNVLPQDEDSAIYIGGWEMFMRPRDFARFGQLYLDEGKVDPNNENTRIIDSAWINHTTIDLITTTPNDTDYGAWWWVQCQDPQDEQTCFDGNDAYVARGFGGRRIFLFPDLELMVVMTSNWLVSHDTSETQAAVNEDIMETVLSAVIP